MRRLLIIGFVLLLIIIASNNNQTLSYTSGAPLESTNAPGETSCSTNSLCHTGGINKGKASLILTSMDDLSKGYVPGTTYTLMPYIYQNGITKVGFETVALLQNGNGAGSVNMISTLTQAYVSGDKQYVTHTASGNTNVGMHDWMYEWTAPTAGSGKVIVYAAFVASNNDMTSAGDSIYTDSLVIEENTSGINQINLNELQIKNIYFISSTTLVTEYNSLYNLNAHCEIENMAGQKIYSHDLIFKNNQKSLSISLPTLKNGIYLIGFSIGNKKLVKKTCLL